MDDVIYEASEVRIASLRDSALEMFAKRLHRIWQTSDMDWSAAFRGLERLPGMLGPRLVRLLTMLDLSLAFAAVTQAEALKPHAQLFVSYLKMALEILERIDVEYLGYERLNDDLLRHLDHDDAECMTRVLYMLRRSEYENWNDVYFTWENGDVTQVKLHVRSSEPFPLGSNLVTAVRGLVHLVERDIQRLNGTLEYDEHREPFVRATQLEWVTDNKLWELPTTSYLRDVMSISAGEYLHGESIPLECTRVNLSGADRVRIVEVRMLYADTVRGLPAWLCALEGVDRVCISPSTFEYYVNTPDLVVRLLSNTQKLCLIGFASDEVTSLVSDLLDECTPREIRWVSSYASPIVSCDFPNDAERLIVGRKRSRLLARVQTLVCEAKRPDDFALVGEYGRCSSITVICADDFNLLDVDSDNDADRIRDFDPYGMDTDSDNDEFLQSSLEERKGLMSRYAVHRLFRAIRGHLDYLEYLDLQLGGVSPWHVLAELTSVLNYYGDIRVFRYSFWEHLLGDETALSTEMSRFNKYTWSIVNRDRRENGDTYTTVELRRVAPRGQKRTIENTRRLLRL